LRRTVSSISSPRAPLVLSNDKAASEGDYTSIATRLDSVLASKPALDIAGPTMRRRFSLHLMRGQLGTAERDLEAVIRPLAMKVDPAAIFEAEATIAEARIITLDDSSGARARLAALETTIARSGAAPADQKSLYRAYDALGQRDSVVAVYEYMLASRNPEARLLEDVVERARALKRLEELYEERGNVAQAIRRYREFMELWKDADPALQPVVQDVRERITRLEQKRG
ncbi:hypothetical protein, partial [Gemmatimonas sp.]|uniref:hypothetical protein n=1 Tax=Gemmatimonas sp. TaxID=1962908 RepID=UPI003563B9A6